MSTLTPEDLHENYLKWWDEHTRQASQIHERFLEMRQAGQRQLAGTIELQLESCRSLNSRPGSPLFTLDDLNEFAAGSVAKCLGNEYAVYDGRRCSRIPNGDFLMMSRILSIRGRKGEFEQSASIVAEYDVPEDAWYFAGELCGHLPYSICIEVALQPCGMLSAYLGTPLRYPEVNYYFRNLDGETVVHRLIDVRGKTVLARAELLKTIFYGSTVIQHFFFELECEGEVFFEGNSSFGYFSAEAMAAQTGLDGGKIILPWLKDAGKDSQSFTIEGKALEANLPRGKLSLLDSVVIRGAGNHQEGYAYANRRNSPQDWFYACHFHEDPVMPGSLGIEAIIQVMRVFVQQKSKNVAAVDLATGQKMKWRYRGQVLQHHRQMQMEVHFHKTQSMGKTKLMTGDASLWADSSRIYEVRNMAITIEEALG